MKKLICMIMACAAGMFLLSGCAGKPLCTDTDSGVTIELYNMRYEQKGVHLAIPEVTIRNRSGEPITAVFWRTVFYDRDGNELGEKLMFWQAEKEALADGADLEDNASRYVIDMKETPASFTAELKEIRTEAEYPLDRIPEEGEYLYEALGYPHLSRIREEPPVRIACGVDRSGYLRTAVFEGELLKKAVDAFMKIRVGSGDAPFVTDNYNWIQFDWEDGSSEAIRLNLQYLEVPANGRYYSYYLEDLDAFWELVAENLTDPSEPQSLEAYTSSGGVSLSLQEPVIAPSETDGVNTMHGTMTVENRTASALRELVIEVTFLNEDEMAYGHQVLRLEAGLPDAGKTAALEIEADLPENAPEPHAIQLNILGSTAKQGTAGNGPLPEGEYLYKALGIDAMEQMETTPPELVEVHIDRMGSGQDYVFRDENAAAAAAEFMKIIVGPDGAPEVTDNYNRISFRFADGTECVLRLNLYALEYRTEGSSHSYYLAGIEDFMTYAAENGKKPAAAGDFRTSDNI